MPIIDYVCAKCSKSAMVFEDESLPIDDECAHEWVRRDIIHTAAYTKAYESHHRVWDSNRTADSKFKEFNHLSDVERDEKTFHDNSRK